jgi:hypothetical protein
MSGLDLGGGLATPVLDLSGIERQRDEDLAGESLPLPQILAIDRDDGRDARGNRYLDLLAQTPPLTFVLAETVDDPMSITARRLPLTCGCSGADRY